MSGRTPRKWWSSGWSSIVGAAVMAQPDPKQAAVMIAQVRSNGADAKLIARAPGLLQALEDLRCDRDGALAVADKLCRELRGDG